MFFNGFTLLLMFISVIAGFAFGIKVEQAYQRSRRSEWLNGETVEDHMRRDGWTL
jgi:hypothetical protein